MNPSYTICPNIYADVDVFTIIILSVLLYFPNDMHL